MSRETFNDRTIAGGDASTNGYLPASNSPVRSRFDFFRKKGETWFRGSTEKKYQRFTEQYTATRPEWNNEADNEAFRTRFSALFLILCDGSVGDAWKAITVLRDRRSCRNETLCELTKQKGLELTRHFEITFAIGWPLQIRGKLPRTISITRCVVIIPRELSRHKIFPPDFYRAKTRRCKHTHYQKVKLCYKLLSYLHFWLTFPFEK